MPPWRPKAISDEQRLHATLVDRIQSILKVNNAPATFGGVCHHGIGKQSFPAVFCFCTDLHRALKNFAVTGGHTDWENAYDQALPGLGQQASKLGNIVFAATN